MSNDPPNPGAPLLTSQSAMNRSTRGQWQLYAAHRSHIERLIVPRAPGQRICVLGAGNCNDLDLRWMLQVFGEVHLVDIDATSLAGAVRRQQSEPSEKLQLHAPVDLTGVAEFVGSARPASQDAGAWDQCLRRIESSPAGVAKALGGRQSFDVVLSPCVLSQLMIGVRDAIGNDHVRYPQLRGALRSAHLRLMIELLKRGGQGLLLLDVVSTEHFAELAQVPSEQAQSVMGSLIARGKCFAAITPDAMKKMIGEDAIIRRAIGRVGFAAPWIWHLGLSKAFVVYAMQFTRTAAEWRDQPP